jgi:hypothetical protein
MNFRFTQDGKVKEIPYQAMVSRLDMGDEVVHGAPLSSGGAPQALTLMTLLQKAMPEVKVEVWMDGNQIF